MIMPVQQPFHIGTVIRNALVFVTLIYYYQPDLEPLFEELARHLSQTDLQEIKNVVAELRQRIERFDENSD